MSSIRLNRILKDPATRVEALGRGIQTIIIRSKAIEVGIEFMLYPTFTPAHFQKHKYKERYGPLVERTAKHKDSLSVAIKYWARCEQCIPIINEKKIKELSEYFIWTTAHVNSYFREKKGKLYVLVLRVFKMPDAIETPKLAGYVWARYQDVYVDDKHPVLSDSEFSKLSKAMYKQLGQVT